MEMQGAVPGGVGSERAFDILLSPRRRWTAGCQTAGIEWAASPVCAKRMEEPRNAASVHDFAARSNLLRGEANKQPLPPEQH